MKTAFTLYSIGLALISATAATGKYAGLVIGVCLLIAAGWLYCAKRAA